MSLSPNSVASSAETENNDISEIKKELKEDHVVVDDDSSHHENREDPNLTKNLVAIQKVRFESPVSRAGDM